MKRGKSTDIVVCDLGLSFDPVGTRVPLRFGSETVTEVSFARVRMQVETRGGGRAEGWGESPLNVGWAWPSALLSYRERSARLEAFCRELAEAWLRSAEYGHPIELGHRFIEDQLCGVRTRFEARRCSAPADELPWLASLICAAPFDIALHDAFGRANGLPTYRTYGPEYMSSDLSAYFEGGASAQRFAGRYPVQYLCAKPPRRIPVWHLVAGADALRTEELTGDEPDDGYPVTLEQWLRRDGPMFLKIKLCGVDWDWDYSRLLESGEIGRAYGSPGLSADFNCMVSDGEYVPSLLERLRRGAPQVYDVLRYVEQPFAVDLHTHDPAAIQAIAAHKPVFIDESADTWRSVARSHELGWTGVALKTCKTQTGALLALAWAKEAGMELVVQDLSNARLAQIPHVLLAAHAGIELGVESNGMQFYPAASATEARIHPGLYRRHAGMLDLASLSGPGFGYRLEEFALRL